MGEGVEIGRGCVIGNFCEINSGARIGDGTLLNSHVELNSGTVVGSRCIMGAHSGTADEVLMTSHTERIEKRPCRIGDDCKIGIGAHVVCCDVGDWCTIGAGAVVLERRIPPREVWAGVPARRIRGITPEEGRL